MKGIAGAPVSFGVFEMTADGSLPGPDEVLGELRDAGYDGVDLGPVGWMGDAARIGDRLRRHGLTLCGGWVDLPLSDDAAFAAALPGLDEALEVFTAAAEVDPQRPPLPTLADSGSDLRRAHPGGRAAGLGLDDAGWQRLAANLNVAADRVRAAGLEPTFHHHVGTYVETPAEIGQLLDRTDVGLTLDTGHLLLGGGDPVDALGWLGGRVNHVHVKDARMAVLEQAVSEGGDMRTVWERGVFPVLGAGDLDVSGFMDALAARGFDGWLVVEQDVVPYESFTLAKAAADQRANREALRRWIP
ncbi:MAG: TIM barrel protein [Actinomycetota bacterium]